MYKLGLIINPVAGIGGKAGLKGSDGEDIQRLALQKGAVKEAGIKTKTALLELIGLKRDILFYTAPSSMGEDVLREIGFRYIVIGKIGVKTTGEDTERIAGLMKAKGLDLLIFAGGDGTARNIFKGISAHIPAIGIPAGVKIHSGVYANNPKSAGEAVKRFILSNAGIQLIEKEVMDIDEEFFRREIVKAKLYGYLSVPEMKSLIQNPKASGKQAVYDIEGIAEEIRDRMEEEGADVYYIFGTGSTTNNIMKYLGYEASLLGVDIVYKGKNLIKDASEKEIYSIVKGKKSVIIVTVIGGQGHILGRGNQQISPRIIKETGTENIWIVSYPEKIYELGGNPLLVDTSSPELDEAISGYRKVITGWQQYTVCKVSC